MSFSNIEKCCDNPCDNNSNIKLIGLIVIGFLLLNCNKGQGKCEPILCCEKKKKKNCGNMQVSVSNEPLVISPLIVVALLAFSVISNGDGGNRNVNNNTNIINLNNDIDEEDEI